MADHELHIGDLMNQIKRQKALKDKLRRVEVEELLKSIFGEQAMSYIRELHVRNDSLIIHISSSTFRHELSMSVPRLKERLNEKLVGFGIKDIILK